MILLPSDIRGSSYTTTFLLLPHHIPPQFLPTLQGAFAVWGQSLSLAYLKFNCFQEEYIRFKRLYNNASLGVTPE